jgi:hypothetical protein
MTFTEVYLGQVGTDDFRHNERGALGTRTATRHAGGISRPSKPSIGVWTSTARGQAVDRRTALDIGSAPPQISFDSYETNEQEWVA